MSSKIYAGEYDLYKSIHICIFAPDKNLVDARYVDTHINTQKQAYACKKNH